jgi:hypothetical protein
MFSSALACDFTYKGKEYSLKQPTEEQIQATQAWKYEDGEPPLGAAAAHRLAKQWIMKHLGADFVGTAYTTQLN